MIVQVQCKLKCNNNSRAIGELHL